MSRIWLKFEVLITQGKVEKGGKVEKVRKVEKSTKSKESRKSREIRNSREMSKLVHIGPNKYKYAQLNPNRSK